MILRTKHLLRNYWLVILIVFRFSVTNGYAQSGVSISSSGTSPIAESILDINSLSKGVLIPRMSNSKNLTISDPPTTTLTSDADDLMVFDTDLHQICIWNEMLRNWQCIKPDGGGTDGNSSGGPMTNFWSYYYNAAVLQDLTLSGILIWNDSDSDPIRVGIFKWTASESGPNTGSVLAGQGIDGGFSNPQVLGMVAEAGLNLEFTPGELMYISFAQGGATSYIWVKVNEPVENTTAWKNNSNLEGGSELSTNP